jgi:serine/threonine protein kinase
MSEKQGVASNILDAGTLIAKRYRIQRLIGIGGMAVVYLAIDEHSPEQKKVALKILHKEFVRDSIYVERFIREVAMINMVDHLNVVKTFDIGTSNEVVYFTMEYVSGKSLEELVDHQSFSIAEISRLIIEISEGLNAIHAQHIVHRDLKPANILIDDTGLTKITDFGIAREKSSKRLTAKTMKVGSICYIAPEIWLGKPPTPAVDFYSLGIVLYEIATGIVPFEDDFPGKVMNMHLENTPRPPIEINHNLPSWLNELILWLLKKSPNERPQSGLEIITFVKKHATDKELNKIVREINPDTSTNSANRPARGKTFVFRLNSSEHGKAPEALDNSNKPRRSATIVIPLPRHAAFIFEIEKPSRDFIYLGLFLISLQVFDGVLTSAGIDRFSIAAEGNYFLRTLMYKYGPENTLLFAKLIAIIGVIFLTILAKRMRWIKNIIAVLSCIYLIAAIIPWLFILLN